MVLCVFSSVVLVFLIVPRHKFFVSHCLGVCLFYRLVFRAAESGNCMLLHFRSEKTSLFETTNPPRHWRTPRQLNVGPTDFGGHLEELITARTDVLSNIRLQRDVSQQIHTNNEAEARNRSPEHRSSGA